MNVYRQFVLLVILLAISACTNSTKLIHADGPKVQALDLQIVMGELPANLSAYTRSVYLTSFRAALEDRLPKIFSKNGVKIRKVQVVSGNRATFAQPLLLDSSVHPSHALTLVAKRYVRNSNVEYIEFDATLQELPDGRLVWTARPTLELVEKQPKIRSEIFGGYILSGLTKDSKLALPTETPVDLMGKRIGLHMIWEDDR